MIKQSPLVRTLRAAVDEPDARLVVFTHAGAHPGSYFKLAARLRSSVEVLVVTLRPGPATFAGLIGELGALESALPRVFIGHSLGGLLAWHAAAAVPVAGLCISGLAPPGHATWRRMSELVALGRNDLLRHLTVTGAMSVEVLAEPSLVDWYIEAFRADIAFAVDQLPREIVATEVPLLTLCGRADAEAPCRTVREWSAFAGTYHHATIEGAHDFFFASPAAADALASWWWPRHRPAS